MGWPSIREDAEDHHNRLRTPLDYEIPGRSKLPKHELAARWRATAREADQQLDAERRDQRERDRIAAIERRADIKFGIDSDNP